MCGLRESVRSSVAGRLTSFRNCSTCSSATCRWLVRAPCWLYRKAKEQVTHSLVYSYNDRRKNKGNFRKLWIQRINAAARANGMTYNRFIQGLGLAGVEVDRKILADLAVNDAPAFAALVETAKAALPEDVNAPKVTA